MASRTATRLLGHITSESQENHLGTRTTKTLLAPCQVLARRSEFNVNPSFGIGIAARTGFPMPIPIPNCGTPPNGCGFSFNPLTGYSQSERGSLKAGVPASAAVALQAIQRHNENCGLLPLTD